MTVQEGDRFLQDSKRQHQAATRTITITGLPGSQGSLHVTRQLQFNSSQPATTLSEPGSQQQQLQDMQEPEEHGHIDELLARGVHCVTVKWLTDSLAAGKL